MPETYTNITLLLLPNQLFADNILESTLDPYRQKDTQVILNIIMLEHSVFFGKRAPYGQMKFNKLKLLYQMAAARVYCDITLPNKYGKGTTSKYFKLGNIKYITDKPKWTISLIKQIKANGCEALFYFDPVDTQINKEYVFMKAKLHHPCFELVNPGFINTKGDLETYHKTKKSADSYFHAGFYQYQRKRLPGILPGTKTYDTENRNKMPLAVAVPKLPTTDNETSPIKKILSMISKMIEKHPVWSSFPGSCDPETLQFPLTHDTSANWLSAFCKGKIHDFGKYQDAIDGKARNFLFHSCISPMLNIGLLTPKQVVDTVRDYYKSHKSGVPIASYEGFIRQVLGWREYQRYIYIYAGEKMRSSNIFGNKEKLNDTWYNGTTGITPVDDAIKMAFRDGYLHHIMRLMVMGNIMNLAGLHPHEVYKWFMEFSLDSYDWVMVGNVYSMALWADGGLTMRKPYFSSSAYLLKMSTYGRDDWCDVWDNLFHSFIDRNSAVLSKTYYAGLVRAWNKKSASHKQSINLESKQVIKKITA